MTMLVGDMVEFHSGGNRLIGTLYNGAAADAPAILVTGSWTTVKEQMAGLYARKLAEKGFRALAFDFAMFGESEGEPRERESPSAKIDDIEAASRWLVSQGGPVGGLAVCASAGYMAHAIARGAPIAAFATVAAWLHDAGSVGEVYDGDAGVAKRTAEGEAALRAYEDTGEVRYVSAFDEHDPQAAMGAMVKDYYGDPRHGAVPEWTNRLAILSWPEWLRFDGVAIAPNVSVPTLLVHSKDAAFPDNAQKFADAAPDAAIDWRAGGQIDFYYKPAQVDPAVTKVSEHFRQHLQPLEAVVEPAR